MGGNYHSKENRDDCRQDFDNFSYFDD